MPESPIDQSRFEKIIKGELPAEKIYEDERVIAFLTIRPLTDGHALVIPKKRIEEIWDLSDDDYKYLWRVTNKIALHLRTVMEADRVGVVVKGQSFHHVHIHLIPVMQGVHTNFDPNPKAPIADDKKLAAIAQMIRF